MAQEIINLVSSEDEIIEILSSPPKTPENCNLYCTKSPVFDQKNGDIKGPACSREGSYTAEINPLKSLPYFEPKCTKISSNPSNVTSCNVTSIVTEKIDHYHPHESPLGSIAEETINNDRINRPVSKSKYKSRKRRFKETDSIGSTKRGATTPKAAPIMSRIKAGNCVECVVFDPLGKWTSLVIQELNEAGCKHCKITHKSIGSDIDGVELIVQMHGYFDDMWDDENQVFVKCDSHKVYLDTSFVILSSMQFEKIVKMEPSSRFDYFKKVEDILGNKKVTYFFPEFAKHYKKQIDKYNREIRKRVSTGDSVRFVELPPIEPLPSEEIYILAQIELEVSYSIHAVYPRKNQEAAELIANGIIDSAYKRYTHIKTQPINEMRGQVRSLVTFPEISVESLVKIPGLPPRIAKNIIEECQNIGNIRSYLGINKVMRLSRIKLFGKGEWNEALIDFLECEDPSEMVSLN